jgi:hypothetical protein
MCTLNSLGCTQNDVSVHAEFSRTLAKGPPCAQTFGGHTQNVMSLCTHTFEGRTRNDLPLLTPNLQGRKQNVTSLCTQNFQCRTQKNGINIQAQFPRTHKKRTFRCTYIFQTHAKMCVPVNEKLWVNPKMVRPAARTISRDALINGVPVHRQILVSHGKCCVTVHTQFPVTHEKLCVPVHAQFPVSHAKCCLPVNEQFPGTQEIWCVPVESHFPATHAKY